MIIQFKAKIKAPIMEVFAAVTTKAGYQGWWTDTCDIDAAIGGISSIRFEKDSGVEEMIFQTMENMPCAKLVWNCTTNNVFTSWEGTTLTYELWADGNKTQLLFTQASKDNKWDQHADYGPSTGGWSFFMDSLKSYCEKGKGKPWS